MAITIVPLVRNLNTYQREVPSWHEIRIRTRGEVSSWHEIGIRTRGEYPASAKSELELAAPLQLVRNQNWN